MPQACATMHFCKAAGKVCPHICWTGRKALPGRAMPERNMKERFCLLCRKIDDSENERFSMGCNQTEQISLAAPTFYCHLSLLLQCCLETWVSWCSKLEILLRNFFSVSEILNHKQKTKKWREQEEKAFSTQRTLLVLDYFWQTDAGQAGATSQRNWSQNSYNCSRRGARFHSALCHREDGRRVQLPWNFPANPQIRTI